MGWKSNINVHFSKQMLHSNFFFFFFFFLSFNLSYLKKCAEFLECCCRYIPYMFSILIKALFEYYILLIDLVPKAIKKYDLNVTLLSQISLRN